MYYIPKYVIHFPKLIDKLILITKISLNERIYFSMVYPLGAGDYIVSHLKHFLTRINQYH